MKQGSRKMWIYFTAMFVVLVMLIIAVFQSISLSGDNLVTIITMVLIFAAIIAGANVGEHFSNALKVKYQK